MAAVVASFVFARTSSLQAKPRPQTGRAAAACAPDPDGFCTARRVRFAVKTGRSELRLNTSLGSVVAVEFPAQTQFSGTPALGNAAFFSVEGHSGSDIDARVRLLIRPKLPATAQGENPAQYYGVMSNLQVFLVGAPTLNLKVRLARPEVSVYSVVLSLPAQAAATRAAHAALDAERQRLRREHEAAVARVEATARDKAFTHLLDGMLKRLECAPEAERARRDFLTLQTESICRIGDHVYIRFQVRNRRRNSVFHFAELQITEAGRRVRDGPIEPTVRFEVPTPAVGFGEQVRGVAAFRLPEGGQQFGPWTLVLVEDGGRNRKVRLTNIGF